MSAQITQIAVPEITPFWQRMPKFFLYPLHTEPLIYMGFLAAATLLGFLLPVPSPFDHLIVHAGVWLAFIRYAYKTLDQTARGLLTPDQHKFEADPERTNLPYKQFGIFMVMGFALSVAQSMGGLVLGAVAIFATLAMPASVMILALTRSFWAGLNPLGVMSMMSMIGLPYLGLCAFLFLLMASEQALSMFLAPLVSPWLLLPVVNFVAMYFTLIMFNMMGYVVHRQVRGAIRRKAGGADAKEKRRRGGRRCKEPRGRRTTARARRSGTRKEGGRRTARRAGKPGRATALPQAAAARWAHRPAVVTWPTLPVAAA